MIPLIEKYSITPDTLGNLIFLSLNSQGSDYVHKILREYLIEFQVPDSDLMLWQVYEAQGLIKFVQTGKKGLEYRVRLSDLGLDILKSLREKPEHELAQQCTEYLFTEYEKIGQKEKQKNRTKTRKWISEFLYHKETYTFDHFKAVLRTYLDSFDYEKRKYILTTENLFFKRPNAFASRWSADNCPILEFIESNQSEIRKNFRK